MTMTRNDFIIASDRPDVSFALCLEASADSGAMHADIPGFYQVPVDLVSDLFGCPTSILAEFVAEVKEAPTIIETDCRLRATSNSFLIASRNCTGECPY